MENKLLKIGGLSGLLIVAFSVFYYFVIFLPKERQNQNEIKASQELYERQLKCADAGARRSRELESESGNSVKKYIYNQNLETCIIRYGSILSGSPGRYIFSNVIEDVYTGAILYSYGGNENGVWPSHVPRQELFIQKEVEFFGVNFY